MPREEVTSGRRVGDTLSDISWTAEKTNGQRWENQLNYFCRRVAGGGLRAKFTAVSHYGRGGAAARISAVAALL